MCLPLRHACASCASVRHLARFFASFPAAPKQPLTALSEAPLERHGTAHRFAARFRPFAPILANFFFPNFLRPMTAARPPGSFAPFLPSSPLSLANRPPPPTRFDLPRRLATGICPLPANHSVVPNHPKATDEHGNLWCPRCKCFKPRDGFAKLTVKRRKSKGSFYGVQVWCRICQRERRIQYHSAPRAHLLALVQKAARRKWRECTLDREWAVRRFEEQGGLCYYTGIQMTFGQGNGRVWTNASLDRMDSALGYLPANCVLCCAGFNLMKTNLTLDAITQMCRAFLSRRTAAPSARIAALASQESLETLRQMTDDASHATPPPC